MWVWVRITYAWSFLVHFVFIIFFLHHNTHISYLPKNCSRGITHIIIFYRFSENPSMEKINIKKLYKKVVFLFAYMKYYEVIAIVCVCVLCMFMKISGNLCMCVCVCVITFKYSSKRTFFREKFNVNAGNLKDILVCLWMTVCMCVCVCGIIFIIPISHLHSSCVYVWLNIWVWW